ncbi:MAG: hypothetical protein ACOH10_11440 [Rhodoglobus sp.]
MTAVQEGIAWWGWLLIWTGLVLALVAMLALFAWRLFRKFLALLDDLADLTDQVGILDSGEHSSRLPKTSLAVLADAKDVREREAARKRHRAERRQDRHDARMARAHAIAGLDPDAKSALVSAARARWSNRAPR